MRGIHRTRRLRFPIPHSGCAAPGQEQRCESRPHRAPTGFLRTDSAQAAPTDSPPLHLPPPPQNPTGIPGAKREAARRWCGAGGIRDGWELPQPEVLPPPCAGGCGGKGARDVPVGARGTPLCPLELGGPIGVRRVGAAGWGHFGNRMGTPYRDASRLSPTDTGSGDTSW